MTRYEYKVVAAPQKGTKSKGVRTPEGRFANSIEQLLNKMAQAGWEYQRAELLPQTERSGMTGSKTEWRNVLVFRRDLGMEPEDAPEEERPEPILIAPDSQEEPGVTDDSMGPDSPEDEPVAGAEPEAPEENEPKS